MCLVSPSPCPPHPSHYKALVTDALVTALYGSSAVPSLTSTLLGVHVCAVQYKILVLMDPLQQRLCVSTIDPMSLFKMPIAYTQ